MEECERTLQTKAIKIADYLTNEVVKYYFNRDNNMQESGLPSHRMASLTLNGYCISPSTSPGVSTNVTKLNFFCFEVEISVERKSTTPA